MSLNTFENSIEKNRPNPVRDNLRSLIEGIIESKNTEISINNLPERLQVIVQILQLDGVDFTDMDKENTFLQNLILAYNDSFSDNIYLPDFRLVIGEILNNREAHERKDRLIEWCTKYDFDQDLFKITNDKVIIKTPNRVIEFPFNHESGVMFLKASEKYKLHSRNDFDALVSFIGREQQGFDFCNKVLKMHKNAIYWSSDKKPSTTMVYALSLGTVISGGQPVNYISSDTVRWNRDGNVFILGDKA